MIRMYEERTYENLMRECLRQAEEEGADTRQGSIIYDALAAACQKLEKFYIDLRHAFDLVFIPTAPGEYLDRKGWEHKVFRNPATSARYGYEWAGAAAPADGERFFHDGLYFTLKRAADRSLFLEAETPGITCNYIRTGTPAVPVNNIGGLTASAFGELTEPGADTESDESYRERIREKIAGPAENGNRQHYKTWCESVAGCARARIIPLFAGENTVMGVIIDAEGLPATQAVVDRVQEYVDPMTLGLTVTADGEVIPVGDGLGDGAANIGAHFAAVAPSAFTVDVSFRAEIQPGATLGEIQADAAQALAKYIKELTLTARVKEKVVIRVSAVSSLLYSLPGLIDYTDLAINGGAANIAVADRAVAMLGGVTVSAVV